MSFRLVSAELIFEIMLLACVIDGGVSHHEVGLLNRTRQTIQPSDAWPATMSEAEREVHENVLDTLIEERCRTWAGVIANGGHNFVRNSTLDPTRSISLRASIVLYSTPGSLYAAGNARQRRPV